MTTRPTRRDIGRHVATARYGWREATLLALVSIPLAVLVVAVDPIAQDSRYHALADIRPLFGIPSFANVASNIVFLLVGALGLRLCASRAIGGAALSWTVFFVGAAAIAAGSAYYHRMPSDATLTWDRLPMTILFMALFSALVSEHVRLALERVLLPVSLLAGIVSVAWWRYADDLRFYAWVQFAPLLAIAFLLLAYRGRYTHREYLAYGLLVYAFAKIAEHFDAAIFNMTRETISGHTVKHLLAAAAIVSVYVMLKQRRRIP